MGYRNEIKDELIFDHTHVDFVEVIGEHFINLSDTSKQEVLELKDEYPIIPHFIGTSLGSAEGVDLHYVEQIAKLLDVIDPPYWSDHIAFTECHGLEIGHLTPVPYSQEALDVFSYNIETVQSIVSTPLVLENITYIIDDPIKEMSEAKFLRELFNNNPEIGMLLDITNVHCNSTNHNYNALGYLDTIDLDRVVQIHYVGVDERNGLLIDNHSYPTQDVIWDLMKFVKENCKNLKGSILERDNRFPTMKELRAETKRAKEILFS